MRQAQERKELGWYFTENLNCHYEKMIYNDYNNKKYSLL